MNWIEKVRYLKHLKETGEKSDEYYIDITPEKNRWQPNELDNIIKNYAYLPNEYIEFIKEFDNLGLSFVTFYGSKGGKIIPLADEIIELSEYTDIFKKNYFPFGKDADGSVFAFNQNQQVVRFDIEDYDFEEEPEHISDNFVEFIDQYVLGPKCEFNLIDPDCSGLYKSLGWI